MSLDLSATMRTFATGLTVVTTFAETEGGRRHDAVVVRSFTSVSLDPPLVSLAVRRDSDVLATLLDTRVWAVSILDVAGVDLAQALEGDREERARALLTCATSPGPRTGALVLDAPGWLECGLHDRHDTGDHTVLIGEVLATGGRYRRPPLVAVNGTLRVLSEA
ncbi:MULTISPECIES: flavin reductase family protein [Streptomyces]|uniref:Flavin reductase family protein n=2 Tax=Streptomyces TaxID=1883 RepID=A0ABW6YVV0_9ACTN|nr:MULTISPECIES: flavin reductase family protein [Streptomyces]MCL3993461.1 flavin reductase family protein [Streptomyces lavenduligriseus]QIS70464.1 flavin reductase family protein [Streptomyces sp. DSM 40868]WDM11789.1 flavin reductase family protein [Streptomyces lavenduligriseus]